MHFRDLVFISAGCAVSDDEIISVIPKVSAKLSRIIMREGELEGYRLSETYIAQLVAEEIRSSRAERDTIKRSTSAFMRDVPQTTITTISPFGEKIKEEFIYVRNMSAF